MGNDGNWIVNGQQLVVTRKPFLGCWWSLETPKLAFECTILHLHSMAGWW
jgi:hypothetical protein